MIFSGFYTCKMSEKVALLMLSIMQSINSVGNESHCSSKVVESMARVLGEGFRTTTSWRILKILDRVKVG